MNLLSKYFSAQKVRKFISNANTESAIEELMKISFKSNELNNTARIVSARYFRLKRSRIGNTITHENAEVEINQINKAILDLLDEAWSVFGIKYSYISSILLVLFCFTIYTAYSNHQNREKVKLAVKEYKAFKANEKNIIAMQLLDYNQRTIDLFPKDGIDSKIVLRDDITEQALDIHINKNEFTEVEARIRDIFDNFFEDLGVFNKYVENNILNKEDINELEYWIEILFSKDNNRKTKEFKEIVGEYITHYQFQNLIDLSNELGYPIEE